MQLRAEYYLQQKICKETLLALRDSVDVLGGQWKTTILIYLAMNKAYSNCFLQIRHDITGISAKILSKKLKDLEVDLLVKRLVRGTKKLP